MQRFNCVLLVDDDGITNFINHRLLKKLNITEDIQSAMNGDKAMQFITQFAFQNNNCCPELILLDLNMPGSDGFDFLNAFKNMSFVNKDKVKLILLTTSTHTKDLNIVHQEYIGYINKPLTEHKLMEALSIKKTH
ncbi:MAG TPA: response regulator [Cytophagaceae bacterium]|jgi:response regulator of citrate/malate metabolism|nr:response regulator [Cytophagaceae bacterium]